MTSILARVQHWLSDCHFGECFADLTDAERAYREQLRQRPKLDDDAFYQTFYSGTGIPRDIPVRLRRLYEKIIGDNLSALQPQDNQAFIYGGIDFGDVLYRVEREFKLKIPRESTVKAPLTYHGYSSPTGEIDGTFDSVVRYLARVLREAAL